MSSSRVDSCYQRGCRCRFDGGFASIIVEQCDIALFDLGEGAVIAWVPMIPRPGFVVIADRRRAEHIAVTGKDLVDRVLREAVGYRRAAHAGEAGIDFALCEIPLGGFGEHEAVAAGAGQLLFGGFGLFAAAFRFAGLLCNVQYLEG